MLDFLSELFDKEMSHSAINTARSALSTLVYLDGKPAGQHPLVIRLLKGVYNTRPSLPKYNVTWDPQIVLKFLKSLSPVKQIHLKMLSIKTAGLIWLLSGQRGQSLNFIDLRNISISKNCVKIRFGDLLKTSAPNKHQHEVKINAYAPDRICLMLC